MDHMIEKPEICKCNHSMIEHHVNDTAVPCSKCDCCHFAFTEKSNANADVKVQDMQKPVQADEAVTD